MTTARLFRVTGLVQGVGFRPTVHRIARELALAGEVFNDAEGVGVILEGPEEAVLRFPEVLRAQKPPLARIDDVVMTEVPATGRTEFTITKTKGGRVRTGITADAATCAACLEDLFDPANRRYRYAFTNCTHCGPRFTITKRLPYVPFNAEKCEEYARRVNPDIRILRVSALTGEGLDAWLVGLAEMAALD